MSYLARALVVVEEEFSKVAALLADLVASTPIPLHRPPSTLRGTRHVLLITIPIPGYTMASISTDGPRWQKGRRRVGGNDSDGYLRHEAVGITHRDRGCKRVHRQVVERGLQRATAPRVPAFRQLDVWALQMCGLDGPGRADS